MPTDQLAKALGSTSAVDEPASAGRRRFVRDAGMVVLTVQCLPLLACAVDHPPSEGENGRDTLVIASGPGAFGHVHDLLIPLALLSAPPVHGVALTTSKAFLHQHHVTLTQEDLALVHRGGTVTQKASSHVFVIALAKGQDGRIDHRPSGSA